MKIPGGSAVCAAALSLLGCFSLPETATPARDAGWGKVVEQVRETTRKAIRRNRIPGLAIALVDSRGSIWEAGFGFIDDTHTATVDADTLFSIQSMSKTFAAVGVLTAVRDGLLDLDAPISRYLPDLHVQSIFEDHPEDRITLRHLLSHTAGFTHEAPTGGNYDPGDPPFDEHVASIAQTWLMFRVGERYQYSNLGIDLAGAILQEAAGEPYADCLRNRVLEPLGLQRTTADPSVIRAAENRATGHQVGFRNLPVVVPMTAAGGVYSSAHDLARFVSSMLREGQGSGELLPAALFREMNTTPDNGGYGLGVSVGRRNGDLYLEHGGAGYGFLTCMAWYPTMDVGIVVLTNSSMHDNAHVELAARVIDLLENSGAIRARHHLPVLPVWGPALETEKDDGWYFDAHPERTTWKPEWSRYLGSYRLSVNAEPRWYARLAMAFGVPKLFFIKVRRQAGGMAVDGVPLLEQEPGLFFSRKGEVLDFRSDAPTWRNIRISKR